MSHGNARVNVVLDLDGRWTRQRNKKEASPSIVVEGYRKFGSEEWRIFAAALGYGSNFSC